MWSNSTQSLIESHIAPFERKRFIRFAPYFLRPHLLKLQTVSDVVTGIAGVLPAPRAQSATLVVKRITMWGAITAGETPPVPVKRSYYLEGIANEVFGRDDKFSVNATPVGQECD